MDSLLACCRGLLHDEDGAQVVEYALIVAVIAISMILGLRDLDGNFAVFLARVANCVTTTTCA